LGIVAIALVDARARFLAPARFGDDVELTSHVKAFYHSSFEVGHRLTVRGALAVEGCEMRLWVTRDAGDASLSGSQSIPDDVMARFSGKMISVTGKFPVPPTLHPI
jgi:4-hydroxybenzoyl-CoA thioesterase